MSKKQDKRYSNWKLTFFLKNNVINRTWIIQQQREQNTIILIIWKKSFAPTLWLPKNTLVIITLIIIYINLKFEGIKHKKKTNFVNRCLYDIFLKLIKLLFIIIFSYFHIINNLIDFKAL